MNNTLFGIPAIVVAHFHHQRQIWIPTMPQCQCELLWTINWEASPLSVMKAP